MLILLSTLLRLRASDLHTDDDDALHARVVSSLRRGAAHVYARGLLRKGAGLCHGVAGSVYALLAASDALRLSPAPAGEDGWESQWRRAVHLARLAVEYDRALRESVHVPDRRWSLYEGLGGMCCAWAEVVKRMSADGRVPVAGCGMPGFDDLGL
jgi:hypothetical protein